MPTGGNIFFGSPALLHIAQTRARLGSPPEGPRPPDRRSRTATGFDASDSLGANQSPAADHRLPSRAEVFRTPAALFPSTCGLSRVTVCPPQRSPGTIQSRSLLRLWAVLLTRDTRSVIIRVGDAGYPLNNLLKRFVETMNDNSASNADHPPETTPLTERSRSPNPPSRGSLSSPGLNDRPAGSLWTLDDN